MLSTVYLQTLVTIMVFGGVAVKLTQDIYKTMEIQKTRKGLLKLNWEFPRFTNLEKKENDSPSTLYFEQQVLTNKLKKYISEIDD
jgi:hypothetical protein